MIPERISIKGFLCYRGEQQITLTDLRLCMLSGPNGSGKSTVFDAMTFVLFGETRGGATHREDLLNKKSDAASVELDFRLDGLLWRARRTLQRRPDGAVRPTQGIYRWSEAKNDWDNIAETNQVSGFNAWVAQNVGFTFDTFTSSTLLRQGKADRLLNARPAERHTLLGAAVGLDQYARLHDLAMARRRATDGQRETLEAQLKGLPIVAPEQVDAARAQAETAGSALALANALVGRLEAIKPQAARWGKLSRDVADVEKELSACARALADAVTIEADWRRMNDLAGGLPCLRTVADFGRRLADSLRTTKQFTAQREKSVQAKAASTAKIEAARSAHQELTARITAADQRERLASARLAELACVLAADDAVAKLRSDLANLNQKLKAFPGKPDKDLENARAELDRLNSLAAALPLLRRFDEERAAVAEAHARQGKAEQSAKTAAKEAVALAASAEAMQKQADAAAAAHRKAQQSEANAAAALTQAKQAIKELERAKGKADCPTCGHPLTAKHLAEEQARRRDAERSAAAARAKAAGELTAAQAELDRIAGLRKSAETSRITADGQARDRERAARQAGDDLSRHLKACSRAVGDLPEPYRKKVGPAGALPPGREPGPENWAAITWPAASDLADLAADISRLPAAKVAAAAAEKASSAWGTLRTTIEVTSKTLAAQSAGLPGDVGPLRAEQATLSAEQKSLLAALKTDRAALKQHAEGLASLEAEAQELANSVESLNTTIAREQARQEGHRESLDTATNALAALSPQWAAEGAAVAAEVAADGAADAAAAEPCPEDPSLEMALFAPPRDAKAPARKVPAKPASAKIASAKKPPAVKAPIESASAGSKRLKSLEDELRSLQAAGASEAFVRLTEARAKADGLTARIAGLKADVAALPAEARRGLAEVERELAIALEVRAARQKEQQQAEVQHQELKGQQQRREALAADYLKADRAHQNYKKLAELLGREQLQRHLLRKAEREIVQFANAVLDKISGGDLLLRLRAGDPAEAGNADAAATGDTNAKPAAGELNGAAAKDSVLDLEAVHRKTAEGESIPVAFLSGSQQFRVAVALALAFGQFAGGNRLGECVIIDEGFGSLDQTGQDVMIEELQRLQSVMQRIILVSHQESFANAFRHGYRFSLKDGEARAERIQE